MNKKIFACLLALLSFGLLWSKEPPAKDYGKYPKPITQYLSDYAKTVSPGDAEQIKALFKDLERQTGIEATVLTINSIGDYPTGDPTIESFATHLFNLWGIGHKQTNTGVLILVAVKDRKCRIELGKGWPSQYDSAMKTVIDTQMIPYFKSGDYSRGIYEGCRGVVEKLTKKLSWFDAYKWHLALGALILLLVLAGFSCMKSGKTGWGWALFAAAGAVLVFLFAMLMRSRSDDSGPGGFGGGESSGGGASGDW